MRIEIGKFKPWIEMRAGERVVHIATSVFLVGATAIVTVMVFGISLAAWEALDPPRLGFAGALLLACSMVLLLPKAFRIERTGPLANTDTENCGRCGYSLDGLDDSARCPECGFQDARHRSAVRRIDLVFRWRPSPRTVWVGVALAAWVVVGGSVRTAILAHRSRWWGYHRLRMQSVADLHLEWAIWPAVFSVPAVVLLSHGRGRLWPGMTVTGLVYAATIWAQAALLAPVRIPGDFDVFNRATIGSACVTLVGTAAGVCVVGHGIRILRRVCGRQTYPAPCESSSPMTTASTPPASGPSTLP